MRNQIMSTFLIVLLVALSLGSVVDADGGLGLVEALHDGEIKCEAKVAIDACTFPHCNVVCDEKYSSDLGIAVGNCLSETICNCTYLSIDPDTCSPGHLYK
ncbi:hypothetical protein PIB30_044414 [Stylosanthes scabra]|uniref:Uncharacterized protein n=1 Tax=Stylosanthes scabra TaxID=79078 RepID=A0ABU6YES8_9FABA|nr:hypothetical protein [Stylosanthes scabra]